MVLQLPVGPLPVLLLVISNEVLITWSNAHFSTAEQTLSMSYTTMYVIISPNIFVIANVAGGYIKEQTLTSFKLRFENSNISNTTGYMTIGY